MGNTCAAPTLTHEDESILSEPDPNQISILSDSAASNAKSRPAPPSHPPPPLQAAPPPPPLPAVEAADLTAAELATADVPMLCEVYIIAVGDGAATSELVVAADTLHFKKTPLGMIIRIGALDLRLGQQGVMEVKELPSGWAFLFPHAGDKVFSVQIYPRDDERNQVKAIMAIFGQLCPPSDSNGVPLRRADAYQSEIAASILRNGVWLAEKLVRAGDDASAWIERKGKEHVDGKQQREVQVGETTHKALDVTRQGASQLLQWTRVGVSLACAAIKVVGGTLAEVTRKSGALDRLKAEGGSRGNNDGTGRVVLEVGMASVDAVLDVYHAIKKAADVVTDQTERTAVQVAGDLYGEDARRAAESGVGAMMDVGRAGAKVLQMVGDETDLALQCATEFADHAITMDFILKQKPVMEGRVSRRDPITFKWIERYASLCAAGLLMFRDEATMQARDPKRPPPNMIGADDIYSLCKTGRSETTNLQILSRDHVIHEFVVVADDRDEWYSKLEVAQKNSHRYQTLAGRRSAADTPSTSVI